jgi:choice-of-anchor B domain-containing protein
MPTRLIVVFGALICAFAARASHDETIGARFVDVRGADVGLCLDHGAPCASLQYALKAAQPGNTVKVGAGIFDLRNVDPESFLHGPVHATGGFSDDDHYESSRPEVVRSVAAGIESRYRAALAVRGFYWAEDVAAAERGAVYFGGGAALQASQSAPAVCVQGLAGQFPCRNVDFQSQISLAQFSSRPTSAANVWGFVDLNDNREYAVIGLRNGTAVVDVTDPVNPREVGTVTGNSSAWREIKIYQVLDTTANRWRAYAYVSTEAAGSGIQTIDMSGLPASVTLASTISDTSRQHTLYVSNIAYDTNVVLPGQQAFLYAAGSNVNSGAWRAYSLADPARPQLLGAAPTGSQYMHDSTSLLITDSRTSQCAAGHNPCEVLADFNENTVDLWDVTDKLVPVLLSSTGYVNVRYTHSGWPSADQRYLFIHDELEELQFGLNTQIYTMDLTNLRAPTVAVSYRGTTTTTDHNGYTKGNYYYVSHYRRGLVVFDVSSPNALTEVANFDNYLAPAANAAGTDGTWGVYPFLPSGNILLSDIENGLFVVKDTLATLGQSAGRLGFVVATASATESAGSVAVRVQRVAGSVGAVSVQYATADGTATAGIDYTAASGTLNWGIGDLAEKTITVTLQNDSAVENTETFRINLTSFGGGASVDGAAFLDVSITDDDVAAPPPSSGGGGGGGDMGWSALVLLAVCLVIPLIVRIRRASAP